MKNAVLTAIPRSLKTAAEETKTAGINNRKLLVVIISVRQHMRNDFY